MKSGAWRVPDELDGKRLDAALRALCGDSWNVVRRAIATGKVALDGTTVTDGATPVAAKSALVLDPNAQNPESVPLAELDIVHLDASVVVVNKPAGVSTIPFGDESPAEQRRTLDALVRRMLSKRLGSRGRPPLGVVHRLDKDTSGLLMFSRTLAAKKELSLQLRRHSVHRVYLALAHGHVSAGSHTSRLVPNRGDGVRGSTQNPKLGRPSTTHLEPVEHFAGATLVRCRLETGRTHQIRIHLSEAGSPLVGEEVYIRRYAGRLIDAPRMMLHALELGFTHPTTGEVMQFRGEPPEDFQRMLASLRKR